MRTTDKLVLVGALVIPVLVATVGWPAFANWIAGPGPSASSPPLTPSPSAAATPVAQGLPAPPTARPTVSARTATMVQATPALARQATLTAAADGNATTTSALSQDPRSVVSSFYELVARHRFDAAAQLWSPHMQAAFPTDENLNQRFSQTDAVRINRVDLLSENDTQATVAVDVVESHRQAGERRFIGNWYLVRGANGWMMDQPELRSAP